MNGKMGSIDKKSKRVSVYDGPTPVVVYATNVEASNENTSNSGLSSHSSFMSDDGI